MQAPCKNFCPHPRVHIVPQGVGAMFGIFGVFVQAACAQVLYLALRLESGSFPQPLRPAEEQA